MSENMWSMESLRDSRGRDYQHAQNYAFQSAMDSGYSEAESDEIALDAGRAHGCYERGESFAEYLD